ncbi:MAG TPA: ATP-binding protein [Anaeromyxobacter sp.]|nr:ATP-binding protein [Anaeromyxobacter sp.]
MSLVPATIAICSASIAAAVGIMSWWMGRAPGWPALRWFAVVTLGSAAYAAGNVVTSAGFSPAAVLVASRFQLAGLMIELWAWAHLADHHLRVEPGSGGRLLRLAFPGAAGLCLVPGLVYGGEITSHAFAPWNAQYLDAVPTAVGGALFVGGLLAAAWILVRFARGWRAGVAHSGAYTLAMTTLLALALNDALVASGVTSLPYLLDVGILAPIGALAWSHTHGFVADARALATLRERLQSEVEQRTAELARARDALHQAEKLAALGQFAAGVAHQVNNPAAVVTANLTYLAENGAPLGAEARQALAEAREAMARITQLVRKLVDAGRLAGDMPGAAPCAIAPVVEDLVAALRAAAGARLSVSSRIPADVHVRGRRDALEKILGALLTNASEAVPADRRGRVEIQARPAEGGLLAVEVVDDGVGMTPEVLQRAFDPFFTTRPDGPTAGAGLGLSVARALAEGMGGSLVLESRPGEGTTARLLLPVAPPP